MNAAAPCLAEATIAGFIAGALSHEEVARVEMHLDACRSCLRVLAEVARTTMGSGKGHPPGATAYIADDVPQVPSGPETMLRFVTGSRPDDVWMVGDAGWVLRWDGAALHRVDAGTSANLRGVAALAPDDAWVGGADGTLTHWDGRAWTPAAISARAPVNALWADRTSHDVWAVGEKGLMLRLRDGRWEELPSGTRQELMSVWGTGANDVWAGGAAGLMLRWDGQRWNRVSTDTGLDVVAISGSGPSDVWAAAFTRGYAASALVHWNGTFWTAVAHTPLSMVRGVAAVDANDVWAVGANDSILHYQPPR
jgi:hypothetical protein